MRPASGAETRRTAVAAPKARPISSGVIPREASSEGMNGDATPYAAYIAA